MFTSEYDEVSIDYVRPVWTGYKWKYCDKLYSSLRLLKTRSDYKLHKRLADIMSNEIRKEIDKEILEEIRSIAG